MKEFGENKEWYGHGVFQHSGRHMKRWICNTLYLASVIVFLLGCDDNRSKHAESPLDSAVPQVAVDAADTGHSNKKNASIEVPSTKEDASIQDCCTDSRVVEELDANREIDAHATVQDSSVLDSGMSSGDTEVDSVVDVPEPDCESIEIPEYMTTIVPVPHTDEEGNNSDPPGHLLVKDDYIYFVREVLFSSFFSTSARGSLRRIPKCGGVEEELGLHFETPLPHLAPAPLNLFKIVSGGDYVYMNAAHLHRLDVRDLSLSKMEVEEGCTTDIAADDNEIFVYDRCRKGIFRAAHGKTNLNMVISTSGEGHVSLGKDAFCYSDGDSIWTQKRDLSESRHLFSVSSTLLGLVCDDRAAIVAHDLIHPEQCGDGAPTATITRLPLDGSDPENISTKSMFALVPTLGMEEFEARIPSYSWLSPIEDGYLFIREVDLEDNVIYTSRIGTDGTNSSPVLRRSYGFMEVDQGRLYWTEQGGLFTAMPEPPLSKGPPASIDPIFQATPYMHVFVSDMELSPDDTIILFGGTNTIDQDWIDIGGNRLPTEPDTYPEVLAKITPDAEYVWSRFLEYPNIGPRSKCLSVDALGRITLVSLS